jgi:hypothetical protein
MLEYNIPNDVFQKIYDFLVTILKIHIKNGKKTRIFIEAAHEICSKNLRELLKL